MGAGATSHVGLTAFYEPFRLGPFSAGPTLTYAHDLSQTMQVHQVTLGLRWVGYMVQPKATRRATSEDTAQRRFAAEL